MNYKVVWSRKIDKQLEKCPIAIQEEFKLLVDDIKATGPIQKRWRNFSKLSKNTYHCHLSYHWIACWKHDKETIIVEVYYVGSREKAPY